MSVVHRFETVVVGGGQAGLAAGYYLKKLGRRFVIFDSGERIGDAWRNRWDSLRLFTPAALSGLPGRPFSFPGGYFPKRDEVADYLKDYADRFDLPVRPNRRVDSLRRESGGFELAAADEKYLAENVIVATGPYHTPRVPEFARDLDVEIYQIHASEYRNPGRLPEGDALVVGAGNSGAEIALELSASRRVYLSGRDTGNVPGGVTSTRMPGHTLLAWRAGWSLMSHLTVETGPGRKGRDFTRSQGAPLVRFSPKDLEKAAVECVPRVEGVSGGNPLLSDGRVMEVASVVWATGYRPDFGWISPLFIGEDGYPAQRRGVAEGTPGLYFLGLPFQHTFFSATLGGVGRDAHAIVEHLSRRASV